MSWHILIWFSSCDLTCLSMLYQSWKLEHLGMYSWSTKHDVVSLFPRPFLAMGSKEDWTTIVGQSLDLVKNMCGQ